MKKVKLNDMELFQTVKVGNGETMQKVPGGWIHSECYCESISNTFVPKSPGVGNQEYEVV